MATPEIYENCYYVQNDPHRCEIKLEKFHFDILCYFGVIKESLLGGAAPGEIGLNLSLKILVDDLSYVLVISCNLKLAVFSVFLPYINIISHLWRFCLRFGCLRSYFKLANGRFRKLQNLLPQKLEGFTDFAEILVSTISTMSVCCVTSFTETQNLQASMSANFRFPMVSNSQKNTPYMTDSYGSDFEKFDWLINRL